MEVLQRIVQDGVEYCLQRTKDGVELTGSGLTLRGYFTSMLPRIRPDKLPHEMLVRAAKISDYRDRPRTPTAVDATAGLGEDSLLLAAAGFQVIMYEHNPVIAALLEDALRKGLKDPVLAPVCARMKLIPEDSVKGMTEIKEAPDIILLDPMFPAKQKNAFSKKKLQLFQKLERPCASEEALLQAAENAGPRKIIIKRPLKGPYLAGRKPGYSLFGKTIRYDCLVYD